MQLKNWEKQRKPDEISKNELGNYSKENKELECQQTINKTNGWFFKRKSNKIDNSDHMLRKPKKAQVNNIRNERLKTKDIVV